MQKPLLVVLAGPTASGKTRVGLALARHFGASIISADSRQFFKEIPIGTAAPTEAEQQLAKHYFVGNKSVTEPYDVQQFAEEAKVCLNKLFSENKIQLLVGGSGLYIKALLDGMDNMPGRNEEIRNKWEQIFQQSGVEPLQAALQTLDPEYYSKVDRNNPQRLIRALEVCESSGKPFSSFRTNQTKQLPYQVVKFLIFPGKESLHQNISQRVDTMMANGMLNEVKRMLPYRSLNALQTVGYKELFEYLDGKLSLPQAIELIKVHTRQYAKRQVTWFKKDSDYVWFHPEQLTKMIEAIETYALPPKA